MNPQSNGRPQPSPNPQLGPVVISPTRLMYWSVRRELWENRLTWVGPLAAAALFLFGFLIHTLILRRRMHGEWALNHEQQHDMLAVPYEIAATLVMGTAFIVGIFYSLDALYGERRDRSILFWKSLPVSDLTTVLAKASIPLAFLPLLSFAITIATQLLMLLGSSVLLLGSGLDVATLWTQAPVFRFSVTLLYHIVTVHGLWYAPLYGWLLLVSAWAPRAPFIWAFLPPFVICGMEKLAFNTTYFLNVLERRLIGPEASPAAAPGSKLMDVMLAMTPWQFLTKPGLWIGLVIAAVFLAAAVQLRRSRGPI